MAVAEESLRFDQARGGARPNECREVLWIKSVPGNVLRGRVTQLDEDGGIDRANINQVVVAGRGVKRADEEGKEENVQRPTPKASGAKALNVQRTTHGEGETGCTLAR